MTRLFIAARAALATAAITIGLPGAGRGLTSLILHRDPLIATSHASQR